jgi:SAM-dependent methyltransferase
MSHPEQVGFVDITADANHQLIQGARVIEIGSFDVNGSVRACFNQASEYVGVDLTSGPGVDLVEFGHRVSLPDASFDLAISGECFEHDPNWMDTFANMVRLTRGGGLVAFTCASRGRPEHGTARTDRSLSPGTQAHGIDYYHNLNESDFAQLPLDEWFTTWRFWFLATSFDLYFAGVRRGEGTPQAALPDTAKVEELRSMMPLPHRVVRLPLRALSNLLPPRSYQTVIRLYWKSLLRLSQERFVRAPRRSS